MLYRFLDHTYIFATIFFTVYSQLIMRWQVTMAGSAPLDAPGKVAFVLNLLLDPWIISGIMATFFAGVSWMLAMTKFEISYAYPFVALNYILILAAGFLLFDESINATKLAGCVLVIAGIIVIAKG